MPCRDRELGQQKSLSEYEDRGLVVDAISWYIKRHQHPPLMLPFFLLSSPSTETSSRSPFSATSIDPIASFSTS